MIYSSQNNTHLFGKLYDRYSFLKDTYFWIWKLMFTSRIDIKQINNKVEANKIK